MNKKIYQSISIIVSIVLALGSYFSAGASAVLIPKAVYVNSSGSDSNSGSAASPFKTLAKGVSVLVAGDTLNITGTFNMPLIVSKSGTASAPINILGNAAVLNVSNAKSTGMTISGSYVNLSGFEVIGGTDHGVFISGKHVKFENSSVHNSATGNGVGICDGTVSWGSAVKIYMGADDVIVRGNTVYENCGEGIGITRGVNILVENNTVYDNFSVNIYIDNSYNVQALNNYSYCANPNYFRSGLPATGILFGNEDYSGWGSQLHDVLLDRNKIEKCRGIRLYNPISGAVHNLTITNNIFNGVAAPFVNVAGAVVSNNVAGTTLPTPTVTKTSTPLPSVTAPATQTQILTLTPVPTGQTNVDVRVINGNDDVEELPSGWVYVDSSDLELVYDSKTQIIGLRFNGVNIPRNATILNAYIQFKTNAASADATVLTIQGEVNPNAAAYTSTAKNVSSRARTTSAVTWSPSPWLKAGEKSLGQQTPNMVPVIQEIISQAGWVAGNSVAIIISGKGKRIAESYEGDAAGAPLLHIEYAVGTTALSMPLLEQTITPMATPTASSLPILPASTPTYVYPTATLALTNQPASEIVYDDTSDAFVFSRGWQDFAAQQAYGGSYKATTIQGASVKLDFTGQSFTILYTDGQSYKGMSIYVDGMPVETIYQKTNAITYQQRWDYPGQLTPGSHTIQLVFVNGYGSLDAVIIH